MTPRLGLPGMLIFLLVVGCAGGCRAAYLVACVDHAIGPTPLFVQDPPAKLEGNALPESATLLGYPNRFDRLVYNLNESSGFKTLAPLSDKEEVTAHVSPGYPALLGRFSAAIGDPTALLQTIRWSQCVLGALTAGLYFLFARRAFGSLAVATLAGLFCAAYPFWIINTAEVNDGALTSFVLALVLYFGTRAGQEGEALTSLLFGLSLASLCLVRAALLPFALGACLWFLLRCRSAMKGWLCALVAVLGFGNGLAPWTVRNYQEFGDIVPLVDSMYLHLWMGNAAEATGGPMSDETLRRSLGTETLAKLQQEENQAHRYQMLAPDLANVLQTDPRGGVEKRLNASLYFVLGEQWFKGSKLAERAPSTAPEELDSPVPEPIARTYDGFLCGTLLGMLLLAFLGWRWSYAWRMESRLATLALLWLPLPYLLSHAEALSGPRLPLDGVLLCYAAFALVCLIPGVGAQLFRGPDAAPAEAP